MKKNLMKILGLLLILTSINTTTFAVSVDNNDIDITKSTPAFPIKDSNGSIIPTLDIENLDVDGIDLNNYYIEDDNSDLDIPDNFVINQKLEYEILDEINLMRINKGNVQSISFMDNKLVAKARYDAARMALNGNIDIKNAYMRKNNINYTTRPYQESIEIIQGQSTSRNVTGKEIAEFIDNSLDWFPTPFLATPNVKIGIGVIQDKDTGDIYVSIRNSGNQDEYSQNYSKAIFEGYTYPFGFVNLGDGKTGYSLDGETLVKNQWLNTPCKLVYFDENGELRKDCWYQIDGKWYYALPTTGQTATGLRLIDGKKYLFDDNGVMQTGWQKNCSNMISKEYDIWYYFKPTGEMATGLQTIDGKQYYFTDKGNMKFNCRTHGYIIDKNGVITGKY